MKTAGRQNPKKDSINSMGPHESHLPKENTERKKRKNECNGFVTTLNHSCGKFTKKYAVKLHGIILLHFGIVTFLFAYGRKRKKRHFYDFKVSGRVPEPQNRLFY